MAEQPFNQDELLIKEIEAALMAKTDSAGIDIKVMADEGWVRLHGVVDALSHKTAAEEIVREIPGVRRIENDITVANEEAVSDKELLGIITAKLSEVPEYRKIGARVHKGRVTLVGSASRYADVAEAVRLVEQEAGVVGVKVERVKVDGGEKEGDADLSRQAEQLLDQMGYDAQLFEVYSDAGVLFVKGLVPTREDRSRIKSALHTLPGIGKLEALLISEDQMLDKGTVH